MTPNQIYHGDCREVVADWPEARIDSIVTDPPYGLEFMGKDWDHGVPGERFWRNLLRVAKPGAHLLAFGGTRTHHRLMCALEDAGWETRDCLMWVYGSGFPKSLDVSKAIDKAAGAKREIVGHQPDRWTQKGQTFNFANDRPQDTVPVTGAPATEDAKRWDGWGTALKPAHEEAVLARKPLPVETEQRIIVGNLWRLEAKLWSLLPAKAAAESFGLSQAEHAKASASAQWAAGERSSTQAALSDLTDTSRCASAIATCLSTVSSWRSTLADPCAQRSMSTTATETRQIIGWQTLKSCLSVLTPLSIIQAAISQPGSWSSAVPAARVLNAAATSINATRELSALASAIDEGLISRQDAGEGVPNSLPIILARKPLSGTVAANVLEHGTGGLNVDGCRVKAPTGDREEYGIDGDESAGRNRNTYSAHDAERAPYVRPVAGRWPANLIHDGSKEVLAGFPETTSTTGKRSLRSQAAVVAGTQIGTDNHRSTEYPGDAGSAARFFYCAKASKAERGPDNTHPTVKPLALMRYLVRLVCPPGGVVLDPFCGSGSTLVAAQQEGHRYIGIDSNADYCEIARRRLSGVQTGLPLKNYAPGT